MTKKIMYLGEIIEEVTVNGMTMYRWHEHLALSPGEAKRLIRDCMGNMRAVTYGYIDLTDPFDDLTRDGILHGIKL